MRRRGPFGGLLGTALIFLGAIILLAMVLPAAFWWVLIGIGLVFIGVRCSCRW